MHLLNDEGLKDEEDIMQYKIIVGVRSCIRMNCCDGRVLQTIKIMLE